MLAKPAACSGCALEKRGLGFAPAVGPPQAKILIVCEALGKEEMISGEPLAGQAGGMFNKILYRNNWDRANFRIHNSVNCRPPGNWLAGAPWEHAAVTHCRRAYLDHTLAEGHPVVVAMGKVAIINLLGLYDLDRSSIRVEDFHGRVIRDPTDKFWVIPTFHPSHLQRGAHNLFGVVSYVLDLAHEVARDGYEPEKDASLVIDPPVDVFEAWANGILAAIEAGEDIWLMVDIETPDKELKTDEGELGSKDRSWKITRINLSVHPDEGWTAPWVEPYITIVKRLLRSRCVKGFWFDRYDVPRLEYNGCEVNGPIYDGMWMFHVLNSDIPRGLGFASCHYSKYPPWKHLNVTNPREYAAADGLQTNRTIRGVVAELVQEGMWDIFYRHVYLRDTYALRPAEKIGLPVSVPKLMAFGEKLKAIQAGILKDIQPTIPEEILPLYAPNKKEGWKKRPATEVVEGRECVAATVEDEITQTSVVEWRPLVTVTTKALVNVCHGCGQQQVVKKHRCTNKALVADVHLEEIEVERYYRRDPFNPLSVPQVLDYIHHFGHKPGRSKKDRSKESTDKESIKKLAKDHPDHPFYRYKQKITEVSKVNGTYVKGSLRRLREDPRSLKDKRLHCIFTHKPSTLRLSSVNPNLQNVVQDRGGPNAIAAGFRECVVAAPGCLFVEPDYSAIEAVMVGWFSGDPNYIRLAKLGIHAFIASHLPEVNAPASLSWSNSDLAEYFQEIKKRFPAPYDQSKRTVHSVSYGQTAHGTLQTYPEVFKDLKTVNMVREVLFSVAPKLKGWQTSVQELAHEQGFLGGPGAHPFAYKHYYYDVYTYRQIPKRLYDKRLDAGLPVTTMFGKYYAIDWGEDAKRAVSFFPQSTAGAVQAESDLRLYKPDETPEFYIGDVYHGQTPLRAPIHDSGLNEVPKERVEDVIEKMFGAMTQPIKQLPCPEEWNLGPYLTVGVEVKVGKNWGAFNDDPSKGPLNLDGMRKVKVSAEGVASDMLPPEIVTDEADEDDEYEIAGRGGPPLDGGLGGRAVAPGIVAY